MSRLNDKQRTFLDTYISSHNRLSGNAKKKAAENFSRRKQKVEVELAALPAHHIADLKVALGAADSAAETGNFNNAYKQLKSIKRDARQRAADFKPSTEIISLTKEMTELFRFAPPALGKYEECNDYRKTVNADPRNAPDPDILMRFLGTAKPKLAEIRKQAGDLKKFCKTATDLGRLAEIDKVITTALTGKFAPLAASPTEFCSQGEMKGKLKLTEGAGKAVSDEMHRDAQMKPTTEKPKRPVRTLGKFDMQEVAGALPLPMMPDTMLANDPQVLQAKQLAAGEINRILAAKGPDSDFLFDMTLKTRDDLLGEYSKARGWKAVKKEGFDWKFDQLTPGQLLTAGAVADASVEAAALANPNKIDTTNNTVTLGTDTFGAPVELARGGGGIVYKYTSASTGKSVAVKKALNKDQAGRDDMTAEMRNNRYLAQGDSTAPGRDRVLTMKGAMQSDNGDLYMVMDLAGGDLRTAKNSFTAATANNVMTEEARSVLNQYMLKQALEGVMYLRDENMVHFDLKEANFMIDDDGSVKVADFGGCQISQSESGEVETNPSGTTVGYVAREANKAGMADTSADTHAAGKMAQVMQRGDETAPHGQWANDYMDYEGFTGALERLTSQMAAHSAKDRPTLEAALESSYLKNLENYREEDIKALSAATIAYGKALDTKKIEQITKETHKLRDEMAGLEKTMKNPATKTNDRRNLLMQWNVARTKLEGEERNLRNLQNTPQAQQAAAKVKEISQRLTRPPEELSEESIDTFNKQIYSASKDAGQFSKFVSLPTLVNLFEYSGIEQSAVVAVTKSFDMVLAEDKASAKKQLDKAVADVAGIQGKVRNAGISIALKDGFKNILQSLAWQYEQKFGEAYPLQ